MINFKLAALCTVFGFLLASLAGALIERHPGYRLQHRGGVTEWSE